MSKFILLLIPFMMVSMSIFSACTKPRSSKQDNSSPGTKVPNALPQNKKPSETIKTDKPKEEPMITNMNWKNPEGKNGDADGPAWVLYSKKGYNQAAVNISLHDIKSNLVRKSDGREVASYLFLGIDVYNNGRWINCADAGLCLVGNGQWHGFINRYQPSAEHWYDETTWWESSISLNKEHEYKLLLKTSEQDEKMTLNIIDITDGEKLADSKTVDFKYTKKDGSNTRYYRDLAIDFPQEVCKDKDGRPTDDWVKVVEYNTNENLYVRNVHCYDAYLFNSKGSCLWTDTYGDYRFLWPDSTSKLGYACTKVSSIKRDYEDILDMDMNTSSHD